MSSTRSTTTAILTSAVLALGLTACGSDSSEAEPSAVRTAPNGDVFNEADVEFASQMIPHHADALLMVDMVQGREVSPELTALAEDIRAAQAPEIELMTDWLTAWDEPVPETARDHVNSHSEDHGSHGEGSESEDMGGMDGMEGMEGMDELEQLEGAAFEERWLELMVEHHEGAIDMARTEQEEGRFADTVALAEDIEAAQSAEIERIEDIAAG